jgi:hypothetical protein
MFEIMMPGISSAEILLLDLLKFYKNMQTAASFPIVLAKDSNQIYSSPNKTRKAVKSKTQPLERFVPIEIMELEILMRPA